MHCKLQIILKHWFLFDNESSPRFWHVDGEVSLLELSFNLLLLLGFNAGERESSVISPQVPDFVVTEDGKVRKTQKEDVKV